jgi:hypothetical protein
MGWHRADQHKSDDNGTLNFKAILFWHVYLLDGSLALRLGRSALMRDWDITVPREFEESNLLGVWGGIVTAWTKFADIQAKTYEDL